jgi:hypothetical protein
LNGEELLTNLLISGTGVEIRAFWTTIATEDVIEYIGFTNAVNAPTSAKCWFVTKLEYDGTGKKFMRARKLSVQNVLDDRVSLFP